MSNPRGGMRETSINASDPVVIPRKVMKGGSYLCAPNYCLRYRPAARMTPAYSILQLVTWVSLCRAPDSLSVRRANDFQISSNSSPEHRKARHSALICRHVVSGESHRAGDDARFAARISVGKFGETVWAVDGKGCGWYAKSVAAG